MSDIQPARIPCNLRLGERDANECEKRRMFATLKLQRTTKVMEVRVKPINTINGNLDVASYESKKRVGRGTRRPT